MVGLMRGDLDRVNPCSSEMPRDHSMASELRADLMVMGQRPMASDCYQTAKSIAKSMNRRHKSKSLYATLPIK